MNIREWVRKKRIKLGYKRDQWWKRVPDTRKHTIVWIGNYVLSAFLLSWIVYYIYLWDVVWVRYTFLIPVLTVILIQFEHYYKWLRLSYKD